MLFDPLKSRLNGFSKGMLNFYLGTQYNSDFPMGNVAVSELETVINAWLVGLHTEIAPVIPRALEWIKKAIDGDELFGVDQNAHRTTLHWASALGRWLQDGLNDNVAWDVARTNEVARWHSQQRPWTAREIVNSGLDDFMAFAYQGRDGFESGVEMYESWTGKREVSLSKLLKPRDFGYALCLQRTSRHQFDEDELFEAGRKMLQANLQEKWLGGGQFIRAATWLKIVYWHHDQTLTPLETVLKAYDNMPKVSRPECV